MKQTISLNSVLIYPRQFFTEEERNITIKMVVTQDASKCKITKIALQQFNQHLEPTWQWRCLILILDTGTS